MTSHASNRARVVPLRPAEEAPAAGAKEPLWRHVVGDVLRRERLAQERTLKDVADAARISMPYLSELERGRKEASSEVLAAAAHALGLTLAGLLTLAQGELVRLASAGRGGSTVSSLGAPVARRQGEVRLAA
ncbi:helix-turn-helix transcriptional regulator [Streptomyces olivoreticuli]